MYKITEVPLMLFNEFSKNYGVKGCGKAVGTYTTLALDPEKAGFSGALGFKNQESTMGLIPVFVLWKWVPTVPHHDDPIFRIDAGLFKRGEYDDELGHKVTEAIQAHPPLIRAQIYLDEPLFRLMAEIMFRAATLASSPDCQKETFWEKMRKTFRG